MADSRPTLKADLSEKYCFIEKLMSQVLFKQSSSKEFESKLQSYDFVNLDLTSDSTFNRNTSAAVRNTCYNFILSMLPNNISNFERFFSLNVLENKKEEEVQKTANSFASDYEAPKSENHVGLTNLGCICYMNAMLQQIFMVPTVRYCLLQIDDKVEPDYSNPLKIDDNSLHQIQRLFSYLECSVKKDYNPRGFCYSFKDWDGNPVNTGLQQDSSEFLGRFLDVMEEKMRPTPQKYGIKSVFGGKTCKQLVCEKGCKTSKINYEDMVFLSLEIRHLNSINESLQKFIS